MKCLDHLDALKTICKVSKKFGMYFGGFYDRHTAEKVDDWDEIVKAAPWLDLDVPGQCFADGSGFLLFSSKREAWKIFGQTVGDEGPTKTNPYNGRVSIYAILCGPDGELMTENT